MAQITPARRRDASAIAISGAMIMPLDSRRFALAWVLVLFVRGLCISFFVGAVSALSILDEPFMLYYSELLRPGLKPLSRPAAFLYSVVAIAHGLQIATMIISSIHKRRLVMLWRDHDSSTGKAPGRDTPRILQLTQNAWGWLFSRRGLFGVDSPYYPWRYAVRETVEIVSQSIQAYNSSVLVGKPWINNLYVAIVFLNCMSTPIIQKISKSRGWSPAAERLTCVAVDTLLDTGTAMLLPLLLILPYARAIDLRFYSFDLELVYNDVWFINLINENRQIFPLGIVDFALKFVPHMSIYMALGSVKSILRRRATPRGKLRPSAASVASVDLQAHVRCASPRSVMALHTLLAMLGLFILACHLSVVVRNDPHMDECRHTLRPWFVRHSACSVYEFNCYRREVDSMDADDLDFLDTTSLVVLMLSHCPALRMSPSIQRFYNLLGIEVYNSTIVEWSLDAAVTSETHPSITYAFLILTNLTEIPPGLLHENLPATLMDIEISHTNLTRVPDDVDTKWSQLLTLYIEYSHLTVLSDALLRLALDDFSVIGNEITELPDFSSSPGAYYMLGFAENPITTIPVSMERLSDVGFFNFVGTKVSVLPDWMTVRGDASWTVFLAETPFCETESQDEIDRSFGLEASLSCTYTDRRIKSRYPLAVTAPLHTP